MTHSMKKLYLTSLITCLLVACGGGSGGDDDGDSGLTYKGNNAPAQINETNAQEIGEVSGEAVLQASSASSLPSAFESTEQIDLSPIHLSIIETSKSIAALPAGLDVSQICTGGGSASSNTPTFSGRVVQKITYNNCSIVSGSYTYTIDGVVRITYDDINDPNTAFSISYQNVTISGVTEESVTLNYVLSCTNLSDSTSCSTSSTFIASDGHTHQVSDFEISGSSTTGYNGSASFSHYTYGSVTINISNLSYGNCGTSPDGGSISFASTNGSSGTINFESDCTVSGTWNTGTSSGSF